MRIFTSYINSLPSSECKIQVLASHLVAVIFIKYFGCIAIKLYIASYKAVGGVDGEYSSFYSSYQ